MALVYSCCFWFSLRLGGILIGVFSMVQGLLWFIAGCLAYTYPQNVQEKLNDWNNNVELLFAKNYIEDMGNNPDKYVSLSIALSCVYLTMTTVFIYGAFKCSIFLMVGYILGEFVRLVFISLATVISLLIIKQNTMDIGLLIGASVATGFILLGMFYLWVCAATLPVVVVELEKDEQAATIARLRQEVEARARYRDLDYPGPWFTVARHDKHTYMPNLP